VAFSSASDGSLLCWNLAGPAPAAFQAWDNNASATGAVFSTDGKRSGCPKPIRVRAARRANPDAERRAAGMRYPLAMRDEHLVGIGEPNRNRASKPDTGEVSGD